MPEYCPGLVVHHFIDRIASFAYFWLSNWKKIMNEGAEDLLTSETTPRNSCIYVMWLRWLTSLWLSFLLLCNSNKQRGFPNSLWLQFSQVHQCHNQPCLNVKGTYSLFTSNVQLFCPFLVLGASVNRLLLSLLDSTVNYTLPLLYWWSKVSESSKDKIPSFGTVTPQPRETLHSFNINLYLFIFFKYKGDTVSPQIINENKNICR